MSKVTNMYCDESCHLENDKQPIFALGCVWCPKDEVKNITNDINIIKKKYGIGKRRELKWTKITEKYKDVYIEIIDYFFSNSHLNFKNWTILNKNELKFEYYGDNSHETFYYKIYFLMLDKLIYPTETYNIYCDIKDSKSSQKIARMKEYLSNKLGNIDRKIINELQVIRSHEVQIMQITDILLGAVAYKARNIHSSTVKNEIVKHIESKINRNLSSSSSYSEVKFNNYMVSLKK